VNALSFSNQFLFLKLLSQIIFHHFRLLIIKFLHSLHLQYFGFVFHRALIRKISKFMIVLIKLKNLFVQSVSFHWSLYFLKYLRISSVIMEQQGFVIWAIHHNIEYRCLWLVMKLFHFIDINFHVKNFLFLALNHLPNKISQIFKNFLVSKHYWQQCYIQHLGRSLKSTVRFCLINFV